MQKAVNSAFMQAEDEDEEDEDEDEFEDDDDDADDEHESESEYFAAESHSQISAASAEAYGRILHGGLDLEAIPENCLLTGHHIRETLNKG